jgi:hypothetical protein
LPISNSFLVKAQVVTPPGRRYYQILLLCVTIISTSIKKLKEKTDLNFTNNIELNIYLRYDDESLVEALNFKHIQERYISGSYKFVIGKVNLQNLIDNQGLISESKAFIAFADQLTGVKQPNLVHSVRELFAFLAYSISVYIKALLPSPFLSSDQLITGFYTGRIFLNLFN